MVDRSEAQRLVNKLHAGSPVTPAVFRHAAAAEPLPAGDLAVIITRLRADLAVPFPEPIRAPADLARLQCVSPAQALVIAGFLHQHFEGFERRQGTGILQPSDGRETTVKEVEHHLTLVERYRNAERFFRVVAATESPAVLE